ncbi:DUF6643 family protein [Streptomyces sp. NPDC020983]|uniref:DUF6643 family protein n=1 Tax=Streptomyces sp. NPDC020983 TaxID=3365106 RepID=UPI0037A0DD2B
MTTPRGSYGGGYGSYPSSASFPDTPIYDSLVAERGTPQIAPIRVPTPYSGFDSGMPAGYGGANLPAPRAALPALPAGPSSPSYQSPQPAAPNGYPGGGYPQPPAPYVPQQAQPPRGGYPGGPGNGFNGNGFNGSGPGTSSLNGASFNGGFPPGNAPMGGPMAPPVNGHQGGYGGGAPQQPGGYEAARPLPPRPVPPRQAPGGHPEEQYPRRNLGNGGGGYYQG